MAQHSCTRTQWGSVFTVRDAGVLPCDWNVSTGRCVRAPTVRLDRGEEALPAYRRCKPGFFDPAMVDGGVRFGPAAGPPLPLASDLDLLMLIDVWGMSSIFHASIDILFPVATTARALLGAGYAALAARSAGARVGAYVVDSHGWYMRPPMGAYGRMPREYLEGFQGADGRRAVATP